MCCSKRDGARVLHICAGVGSTCLPPRAWLLGSWVGSASSPDELPSDIGGASDLNSQASSLGVISMATELAATDGHAGGAQSASQARVSLRVGRFVPCAMHPVLAHAPPSKAKAQCVQDAVLVVLVALLPATLAARVRAVLVVLVALLPATLAARVRPGGAKLKPAMRSRTPSNASRGHLGMASTRTLGGYEDETSVFFSFFFSVRVE